MALDQHLYLDGHHGRDGQTAFSDALLEYASQILGSSELGEGLEAAQLARIAGIGRVRTFAADDLVCDELERSDELYIVQLGTVEVWLDPSSIGRDGMAQRRLAVLQEGQVCGELALLDGGLRSAQLKAGPTGVKLLIFKRRDLLKLCDSDTAIGYRVMFNLACALALRMRLQDMRLYPEE